MTHGGAAPGVPVPTAPFRLADLDHRRRWARRRAPLWFVLGVVVLAVCVTGAGLVVLALVARAYGLLTSTPITEVPLWGWAAEATVAAAVLVAAVVGVSVSLATLRTGAGRVLRDVGARPAQPDEIHRLANVVTALGLGLGVDPPEVLVVDDPAPNTLSVRGLRRRVLVATTGAVALPRDELEALCAHEVAHLHAADARWVTAAASSLGRTRRAAKVLELMAGLLLVVFGIGVEGGAFLLTPLLGGLAIGCLGFVVDHRVGAAQRRLRAEEDEIADVAAVLLARNPAALGAVCDRLAVDPRQVARTSWRAEMLWFESVPDLDQPHPGGASTGVVADLRAAGTFADTDAGTDAAGAAAELRRRAAAAYANARVPYPTRPAPLGHG